MSVLSAPHFHNEEAAFAYVEARLWPNGPVCPRCHSSERIGILKGDSTRLGVHKCYSCRKPFTVTVGTIMERSHVPLRVWLQAMFLLASSKKGISTQQLHRTLKVTLKTAWFLSQRIRAAMASGDLDLFGIGGGAVEVDETYYGKKPGEPRSRMAIRNMNTVLSLVDRDTGRARSMVVTHELTAASVAQILSANVAKEAHLMTDDARFYKLVGKAFADHQSVNHQQDEYVRAGTPLITTNTVEGFFGIFKRGMRGVYQHCAAHHLHRYLAEFDFRYSHRIALGINDIARADAVLTGMVGKRLTYKATHSVA